MTSALFEIRLSNGIEESASPECQREQDTRYCEMRGWDIAHIAEDLDVSGAISPFERPKLSRWLTAGPTRRPRPPRSNAGIARQRIQVGSPHAGQTVTIHLGDTILRIIDQRGELITTVPRLSDGEISRLKAYGTRQPCHQQ